jgi:hypothetical protein
MIFDMTSLNSTREVQGGLLCKACGLCCTGHLFAWAKLRPAELDPAEALGMSVFRTDPTERGFSQPCPLWKGKCTIYTSSHYPHACRAYECKLLKEVLAQKASLPHALTMIKEAKQRIQEVESLLPTSPNPNFRERLVAELESQRAPSALADTGADLQQKADALLNFYEEVFGVTDLVDKPEKE